MTIKIDNQDPNIFSLVEGIDVRDAGRTAEVIFATKVEGQLATVTIRLSYAQAATLAGLWSRFGKTSDLSWYWPSGPICLGSHIQTEPNKERKQRPRAL